MDKTELDIRSPMNSPNNPHDRFFKAVFSREDVAADFLRHHLPAEIASLMTLGSLTIRKDSFVDDDLGEHYSDLLYSVRLHNGQPGFVYVLFEHKSYPEARIALHLLRYLVQIWNQQVKSGHRGPLPVILALVIYHGRQTWSIGREFNALFDVPPGLVPYLPNFRYVLTDLNARSDDDLRGLVELRTALLVMKYIFRDELPGQLSGILKLLEELAGQPTGFDYLYTLLRYLAHGTDKLSRAELTSTVERTSTRGKHIMSTIAAEWIQEGRQEGRQEGHQEGHQEGRREECIALVTRLLRRKFGLHPELGPLLAQLQTFPVEKLEDLAEALFDWAEVSDLTEWIKQQRVEFN
jgi:predicted transposase YdaD